MTTDSETGRAASGAAGTPGRSPLETIDKGSSVPLPLFWVRTGCSGPGLGGRSQVVSPSLLPHAAAHLLLFCTCALPCPTPGIFPARASGRLGRPRCAPANPGSILGHPAGGVPSPGVGWLRPLTKSQPSQPQGHSLEMAGTGTCSPFTRESCTVLGEKSRETGAGWLLVAWPRSVTKMPPWNSVTPGAWSDRDRQG